MHAVTMRARCLQARGVCTRALFMRAVFISVAFIGEVRRLGGASPSAGRPGRGMPIAPVAVLHGWSHYMVATLHERPCLRACGVYVHVVSMGGHIAWVATLHRWPYCMSGHIAWVATLHGRPVFAHAWYPWARGVCMRAVSVGARNS